MISYVVLCEFLPYEQRFWTSFEDMRNMVYGWICEFHLMVVVPCEEHLTHGKDNDISGSELWTK